MLKRRRSRHSGGGLDAVRAGASRPAWRRALGAAAALSALLCLVLLLSLLMAPARALPQGTRTAGGMEQVLQQALLELERSRRSAAAGRETAVCVTLSDADLDDYLAQSFSGRAWPLGLRDPAVAFYTGKVSISARVSLVRLPVRLTAGLIPVARQGRVSITADRLCLGLLPVPDRYRQRLASELQSAVNSVLYATGMRLEALEVSPGAVTATLRPADRR